MLKIIEGSGGEFLLITVFVIDVIMFFTVAKNHGCYNIKDEFSLYYLQKEKNSAVISILKTDHTALCKWRKSDEILN